MVSDGVADETDDEWLQNLMAGWSGQSAEALASLILSESRRGAACATTAPCWCCTCQNGRFTAAAGITVRPTGHTESINGRGGQNSW